MPTRIRFRWAAALIALASCVVVTPAYAWWPDSPALNVPLCTDQRDQETPASCEDGSGGAIVVWKDRRNGNDDIFAQRVSALGAPLWTLNGVPVCVAPGVQEKPRIVSDGAGGAIIVWHDARTGTNNVYAQRLDAAGVPQWTADGKLLGHPTPRQENPQIAADGAGGAIVTWQYLATGSWTGWIIMAQRIDGAGSVQWGPSGIQVPSGEAILPQISPAGFGGAFIAWEDLRAGPAGDVYAQHVLASGETDPSWPYAGLPLCTASGAQSSISIVSADPGSAIVAWEDRRGGPSPDIYAQRISISGGILWDADGLALATAPGNQTFPACVADGTGGAIVAFADTRNEVYPDIYAQRVSAGGTRMWGSDGLPVCRMDGAQSPLAIASDGADGAIVCWADHRSVADGIYAQRVGPSGAPAWAPNGIPVESYTGLVTNPTLVADGNGGVIAAWQDFRSYRDPQNVPNWDIYAQHIDGNGRLGLCDPGNDPPRFRAPTPICGSTLRVLPGDLLHFVVEAADSDPGDVVRLEADALPPGAAMTPALPGSGNPVSSVFDWAPAADQVGDHLLTFSATEGCGARTACAITVRVYINHPPIADAGPDATVECASSTRTAVTLDGRGSSDPDLDPLVFRWWAPGIAFDDPTSPTPTGRFPVGATTARLLVTDGVYADSDEVVVTVADRTPPVITLLGANPLTLECHGVFADPGATAYDVCAGDVSATIRVLGSVDPATPGAYDLTYIASDGSQSATAIRRVNVVDTGLPALSVSLSPERLWPPNHRLVDVHATVRASDGCDADPSVVLTSITLWCGTEGRTPAGKPAPDIVGADFGTADFDFQLRADKWPDRSCERTYVVTYTATDHAGNATTASAAVCVPHDQRGVAMVRSGWSPGAPLGAGPGPSVVVPSVALARDPSESGDELLDVLAGTAPPPVLAFDARRVDTRQAWLGNAGGLLAPESVTLVDADGDGQCDLVLGYASDALQALLALPAAEVGPITLYYATRDGKYYEVTGLFGAVGVTVQNEAPPAAAAPVEGSPGPAPTIPRVTRFASATPNPFRDRVTLALDLAAGAEVSLEIYDLRGGRVRTILRGSQPPGRHLATWDGTDEGGRRVADGFYLVRAVAGGFHASRKVMLIR